MTSSVRQLEEKIARWEGGGIRVLRDEPMSRHTSFRIGGPAALYLVPREEETLAFLMEAAQETGTRVFVLGNGSNVLFDDAGFDGAVVSTSGLSTLEADGELLAAGAGCSLANLTCAARERGLAGLAFAYGIPGSVGGAVVMNAGAYGGEIKDTLTYSVCLDLGDMTVKRLEAAEHQYGYRDSVYRHERRIVLSAGFRLRPGKKEEIAAEMRDYMERRTSKQPLEYPSAGSVFKRPEGRFVGQMVEESGLKGCRIGGAEVSEKHAGFIVNRGGATASDVLALIEHVREVVYRNYGVELECEIVRVSRD